MEAGSPIQTGASQWFIAGSPIEVSRVNTMFYLPGSRADFE